MRIFFVFIFFLSSPSLHAQNISGVVNVYRKVLWVDSANGRVKLSNVSGFAAYVGNKAMLIQMKGATMDETNTASFGNISPSTNIKNAGNYEIGTICGFLSDTLVFERKLNNFYDVGSKVQCVILPKYTNATVVDTLKAAAWDSTAGTGGVLALEVTGTLTLNKPLSANGAGYAGGGYTLFGNTCNFNPVSPVTDYYMPFLANAAKTGGFKGEGISFHIAGKEYARGKQVNGGGGGNNHNAGGGGGGNYGAGGEGGNRIDAPLGNCQSNSPGKGGLTLNTFGYTLTPVTNNKIFMGGGGGAGHDNSGTGIQGGPGGGIIYITAASIVGNAAVAGENKIMANGDLASRYIPVWGITSNASGSDGAGGGGAGGVVILNCNTFSGNTIAVESKGSVGSGSESFGQNQCSGPGGGGGGGVIWFSNSGLPAGVTVNTSGGTNGTTSVTASCSNSANGATPGGNGTTLFNFTQAIKDSSPICMGLVPLQVAVTLNGYVKNTTAYINAEISDPAAVQQCFLQRADATGNYKNIGMQAGNNNQVYHFMDEVFSSAIQLYRVRILSKEGRNYYSPVLRLNKNRDESKLGIDIFPNPSRDKISLQVNAVINGIYNIRILDDAGKILADLFRPLVKGQNTLSLSLEKLPQGILYIKITRKNEVLMRSFMKF